MKKKNILFFVFVFITFFAVKPVYAAELSVCESGCDFSSINDALTFVENNGQDSKDDSLPEGYRITVSSSSSRQHVLANHALHNPVLISFPDSDEEAEEEAYVINGNGATITTNYVIFVTGSNIDIKNLNIRYNGVAFSSSNVDIPAVLSIQSYNLHLDSVSVVSDISLTCPNFPMGIYAMAENDFLIENSIVRNFFMGIMTYGSNGKIDYCNLNENYVSLSLVGDGSVSHSYLGRVISNGNTLLDETNSIGNLRVKISRASGLEDEESDADKALNRIMTQGSNSGDDASSACAMIEEPAIYVFSTGPDVSIHLKKSAGINLNQQTSVEDVLGMFIEDNTLYDGFEFTSSDESVATVVNNKVKLLKAGDVTITAVNDYTNEEYTLVITAFRSTNNPLTYRNSVYVLLGVATLGLISLIFSTIRRVVKEH